jgi:hypothetical protein
MAEDRAIDIKRVTSAMDSTRLSIRDSLEELKEHVEESTDWRHQVRRHPVTSAWVAVACGLVLARLLIPPAGSARGGPSGSWRGRRGGVGAFPYLAGAVGLLTQLRAFHSLWAQVRHFVGQYSPTSRG